MTLSKGSREGELRWGLLTKGWVRKVEGEPPQAMGQGREQVAELDRVAVTWERAAPWELRSWPGGEGAGLGWGMC